MHSIEQLKQDFLNLYSSREVDAATVNKVVAKWQELNQVVRTGESLQVSKAWGTDIPKLFQKLNKKQLLSVSLFCDYGFRNNNDIYNMRTDLIRSIMMD